MDLEKNGMSQLEFKDKVTNTDILCTVKSRPK